MTLRTRLFVSGLAVVVPLSAGLLYLDQRLRHRDMRESLQQAISTELTPASLDRCESDPERFRMLPPPPDDRRPPPGRGRGGGGRPGAPGREGRPAEIFLYRGDFTPLDPRGPALPDDLKAALESADSASGTYATPEGAGVTIATRVRPQDSVCSIAFARMRPRPGTLRDEYASLALVLVSVLGATWLAAGPAVGRMRRLADRVRRSAASRYEQPVPESGSDEVADLARAFNAAGADIRQHILEVQAQRDTLRNFVANTTHDIAIPLTVLQGHLADLDRALDDRPDDRARVRASMEEAHYLSSLLRNLGTVARLDEGEAAFERRPIDLNALVDRVVARHRPLAKAKSVELEYAVPEHPLVVAADLTLLEQAVSNLVDNAVQYNRGGGHVAVVLDARPDMRFALTVSDDGPGVPESELTSLAARRFRGSEARSRRPDGQGLGLTIAAEAVALLQFALAFWLRPGGGLVAEITGGQ